MQLAILIVLCSIIGTYLVSKVTPLTLKNPSFLSYQYIMHFIIFVIPGSMAIALGSRADLALYPITEKTVISTSFAIMWCVVAFPFTLYFLDSVLHQSLKRKIQNYKKRPIISRKNPKRTLKNIKFINFICTLILIFFAFSLPIIPILHIGVSSEAIMDARMLSAFDLPSWLYGLRRILVYFLPIFFLFTYSFSATYKVPKHILAISFLNAIFILGYSTEKAPILFFIISIIFTKSIVNNDFKLSFKKAISLSVLFLFLLIIMFMLFYQNSIEHALISLTNRLFISQISGSYLSIEYYDSVAPFKYFQAVFFRVYQLFDITPTMQASEELVAYYYPYQFENNLWRNVNSFIIQGAWANFGVIGIILAPIWCASIIYFFVLYVYNSPKTPATIAIYAYSAIFMVSLSTNFNNFIYSSGFILTIFIWLFLRKL